MPAQRFRMVTAVYLLLTEEGRTLLLRRYNTGYADGMFSLIAGHVDGGEPLTRAMAREAMEEAGVVIDPDELQLVHVLHRYTPEPERPADERIEFFFTTERWQGEPRILEPGKCDLLDWFHLDQLPDETLDYVRHMLERVREGILYSEYGWP